MVARQVRRSVVMSNLRVGLLPWIQTGLRSERGKTSFTAPSAPLLSNIALNSPDSIEAYESANSTRRWNEFVIGFSIFGLLVLVCSLLVYFLGAIFAWVRRGFRQL